MAKGKRAHPWPKLKITDTHLSVEAFLRPAYIMKWDKTSFSISLGFLILYNQPFCRALPGQYPNILKGMTGDRLKSQTNQANFINYLLQKLVCFSTYSQGR
jgi:hypothetical protein